MLKASKLFFIILMNTNKHQLSTPKPQNNPFPINERLRAFRRKLLQRNLLDQLATNKILNYENGLDEVGFRFFLGENLWEVWVYGGGFVLLLLLVLVNVVAVGE